MELHSNTLAQQPRPNPPSSPTQHEIKAEPQTPGATPLAGVHNTPTQHGSPGTICVANNKYVPPQAATKSEGISDCVLAVRDTIRAARKSPTPKVGNKVKRGRSRSPVLASHKTIGGRVGARAAVRRKLRPRK